MHGLCPFRGAIQHVDSHDRQVPGHVCDVLGGGFAVERGAWLKGITKQDIAQFIGQGGGSQHGHALRPGRRPQNSVANQILH